LGKAIGVVFLPIDHADFGNFWIDAAVALTVRIAKKGAVDAELYVFKVGHTNPL
jgi:hypothetical protein